MSELSRPAESPFADLIDGNRQYAAAFDRPGMQAPAQAGVAMVTCMDSRIDPLAIVGLQVNDAKIIRNPGGRVTDAALEALVLAVHLLGVNRVMIAAHTQCAMASASEQELRDRVAEAAGQNANWQRFPVVADQRAALAEDVARVRSHPLLADRAAVGGFMYDVHTGLLDHVE